MPAGPCCTCICTTRLRTRVPWGIRLVLRRSPRLHSACCHKHSITDQVEDHEHCCLLQTRCLASKQRKALPAQSSLKRKQGAPRKRRLTPGLMKSGAAPPRDHSFVNKLATEEGVLSTLPRNSADGSFPKLFVSVLDSSSLEDATNNFCFQEFPQDPCPDRHGPTASDQPLVSASSEWQRKLEAAEALLILKESSQAPSGSISLLQP
ncbi:DMRT like family C1 [Phyllostomus discolor]|uniref:DMRT like family C1 n=1 Tax=Phyllostomus discolor TaxID=89673 RepID=A0A833ZEZ9_9CHIR|nr:DMRT like family C1 [Phyllostomus discolor]